MTYNLLRAGLDLSSLRQEAISSNIANINTPGYKANRIGFEEYFNRASERNPMIRTHDKRFLTKATTPTVKKQNKTSIQDNGNNVDVDFEMAELSANSIYYDAMISQLNAKYAMTRTSIK